jgi:hypothetical protein
MQFCMIYSFSFTVAVAECQFASFHFKFVYFFCCCLIVFLHFFSFSIHFFYFAHIHVFILHLTHLLNEKLKVISWIVQNSHFDDTDTMVISWFMIDWQDPMRQEMPWTRPRQSHTQKSVKMARGDKTLGYRDLALSRPA